VDIRSKYVVYEDREARIIVANDISERLNQIQKLELQNRTFKEISWLQSHVVRAPLARMLGLVDVLLDEEISNEDRITCLNHLKTSGQELDKVIFDIVKKAYEVNKDFE
jgi:light-regulated signal transduction histidine kinase (bacteriophytochrome)